MRLINKRLKKQQLPRVCKGQVVGAILTRFLLAHRSEIMGEHASLELQKHLGIALQVSGPRGLGLSEASESALAPVVPNPRADSRRKSGRR